MAERPDSAASTSTAPPELTNGIPTSKPLHEILFPSADGVAENEPEKCDYYQWSMDDLYDTLITSWYDQFAAHTFETVMLPLKSEVVDYLQDDGVHLPDGVESSALSAVEEIKKHNLDHGDAAQDLDDDINETNAPGLLTTGDIEEDFSILVQPLRLEDSSDEEANGKATQLVESMKSQEKHVQPFTHLDAAIQGVIKSFHKSIFPKLNWKSPKDASWIAMNKSLRCYVPGDIYLLFKSSNRISSIWENSFFENCKNFDGEPIKEHFLVLRQWMDIHPATEFRCFVINRRFTAISQREYTASYPSILEFRDVIMSDLYEFFKDIVSPRVRMTHYVFDVVRVKAKKVLLVDLNVFGPETDGCLFTYQELKVLYDEMIGVHGKTNGHVEIGDSGDQKYGLPTFRFVDQDRMVLANPWLGNAPIEDVHHCIASGISLQQLEDSSSYPQKR